MPTQSRGHATRANPNDEPRAHHALVVDIDGDGLQDIVTTLKGVNGADGSEGFSILLNRLDGGQ